MSTHSVRFSYALTLILLCVAGWQLFIYFYQVSLPPRAVRSGLGPYPHLAVGLLGIAAVAYTRLHALMFVSIGSAGNQLTYWILFIPVRWVFKSPADIRMDGNAVRVTTESGAIKTYKVWSPAVSAASRESLRRWIASHQAPSLGIGQSLPPLLGPRS